MARRSHKLAPTPLGRLRSGEMYYAPIGEMRYAGDRAQCHLCGRWLKQVGGIHTRAAHDMTAAEYRELFHLPRVVSTAAPDTSARKRVTMLEQIATGQRVQPYDRDPAERVPPAPPTVPRWRSLAALRPDLAAELHPTRNDGLDPCALGPHATAEVWWRGPDCGHEWRMSPKLRSRGRGCPICGRQRTIAASMARSQLPCSPERSLAVRYPELLAEWHPTLNGDLDPRTVAAGSERKVWWRCAECGHDWAAAINDRTRTPTRRRSSLGGGPHGCPACARTRHIARQAKRAIPPRERSFGTLYPDLVCEWHPTRNGDLNPYLVKPYSERKVWWRCAQCGHDWQATPGTRTHSPRGGCRTCAVTRAQRERRAKARRAARDG